MSKNMHQFDGERPRKRAKIEVSQESDLAGTLDTLRKSLRQQQNQEGLAQTLVALRNRLTVKPTEGPIAPQDERLAFLQSWLETNPGAEEIFDIWSGANARQLSLLSAVISSLASIVTLLSSHYTFHALGQPIVKNLLSSPWIQNLNGYLSSSHNDLVLATLKLFNAVSTFAGGREQRALMDVFAWESKALFKLLNMRRRTKSGRVPDALAMPDIRTLYMLFILSFVNPASSSGVKLSLLEQHRDTFASIFKGLAADPYAVVRRVLEVSWSGIWSDARVKRTAKIGVFNESIFSHIVKLYERSQPEGPEEDEVPADLVHHFLLAVCTRPHTGVCFRDRGWYLREIDEVRTTPEDAEDASPKSGRLHNRILANVLKGLKVNDDARQQELALKILASCPELVAGYWPAAALTLEPRLSSKWIANIAFFGSVISLHIPEWSFFIPNGTLYQPTPPPLSSFLENVLPSVNIKAHLSRGLQSTSPLVQHCTALVLAKCLEKYARVLNVMHKIEAVLEEDAESGQWGRRRRDLECEIRRRVPEFQVIVAASQQHRAGDLTKRNVPPSNDTQVALLAESSTRLLWLYHHCLPVLVEETRFDVGKLVQNLADEEGRHQEGVAGLYTLRQLHILRLLRENDQFVWSGKTGRRTHLYTTVPAIRIAVDILFQHDADEVHCWLGSLPVLSRTSDAESPDGTVLGDEQEAIITFLDDCFQRCIKTPYRYLDELEALNEDAGNAFQLSPLVMTVLEQLRAKLSASLLSVSDALALASFVRRKLETLGVLERLTEAVREAMAPEKLPNGSSVVSNAIERETGMLSESIRRLSDTFEPIPVPGRQTAAVQVFLENIEKLRPPSSVEEGEKSAAELVDWLRLVDRPLHPTEILRLIQAVHTFHAPTVVQLWQIPFDCWLLHSPPSSFESFERRQLVAKAIFDQPASGFQSILAALRLVYHYLSSSPGKREYLLLVSIIVQTAMAHFSSQQMDTLKESIFGAVIIRSLCQSNREPDILQGLEELLRTCIDVSRPSDVELVATFAGAWAAITRDGLATNDLSAICVWVPYMNDEDVFVLLDRMQASPADHAHGGFLKLLESLVKTVQRVVVKPETSVIKEDRLRNLISFYSRFPNFRSIEHAISTALGASLPLGLDEELARSFSSKALSDIVSSAVLRWKRQKQLREWYSMASTFIEQEPWTNDTASIATKLARLHPASRQALWELLSSPRSLELGTSHLAHCIRACLDCGSPVLSSVVGTSSEIWSQHFSRVLESFLSVKKREDNRTCLRIALWLMLLHLSKSRPDLHGILNERVSSLSKKDISVDIIRLVRDLSDDSDQVDAIRSSMVDQGLKWAAHMFAGSGELDGPAVSALGLLGEKTTVKAHLLDPVISTVVQNRLSEVVALEFVRKLLSRTQMKPVLVNRHLQSIIRHPSFYKHASPSSSSHGPLIHLVHALFHLHPTNTCQPSHIAPLSVAYGGSQSETDKRLLGIFRLYEETRKTSAAPFLARWSISDGSTTTSAQAIANLDPGQVFRTCLVFPAQEKETVLLDSVRDSQLTSQQLYDPFFVLSLCAQMLVEFPPYSAAEWLSFFRTNVVSLIIRGLSSEDTPVRQIAAAQLSVLSTLLDVRLSPFIRMQMLTLLQKQASDFQERPHVRYMLDLLKDSIKYLSDTDTGAPSRIPAFTTLLLAHALRAVFYPANFIYPPTARFLLQRPELDMSDVPMLYSMLYSATGEWKKERGWMLKFLADAMLGAERAEWGVFKRRRTWDLLASLWTSGSSDRVLRMGIVEILLNLTCSRHIVTSLVLKSALLAWMEMTLLAPQGDLHFVWLKVLENILMSADSAKLDAVTSGAWKSSIGRCLGALLERTGGYSPAGSSLPGAPVPSISALLSNCISRLEKLERVTKFEAPLQLSPESNASKLHTSYTARGEPGLSDVENWGLIVIALWRVAMLQSTGGPAWETMTARMLILRAMVEDGCTEGEWVRKEIADALMQK
ncbi:ribosome 60S biogenesis N-terminal-domain-containing protein [Vararia minispora EC-137]|uniref:Ribosome 60S biogenesis N-terminal-domain-containing protein n=1 Tax=Vararia minispora EC-137 TaxID=1314806 RepID=A0ACB8QFC7_9AGAM|nr:ribosome 60S biogenesis N-terminal-domain-containing protein [Vararia minispora EC-137]